MKSKFVPKQVTLFYIKACNPKVKAFKYPKVLRFKKITPIIENKS